MTDDHVISTPSAALELVLTNDQQTACEKLLSLARVRAGISETVLPATVLRRWSVPLLVGPAASGKEFVCQEVARQLGDKPCRRWDVASWVIIANRSSGTTLEQIQQFIENSPSGCVIYLSGLDSLAGSGDRNIGYHQARVGEVEQLLDWTSSRPPRFVHRDGSTFRANVLVVGGGRFSALWGDTELGTPTGADCWKNADIEPLSSTGAVATWLEKHSEVPTGILRRMASEPFVLHPMTQVEACEIAVRLHAHLPPSLDGIGADEFADALLGPHGWRAVANVVEQALIAGYEGLPPQETTVGEVPPIPAKPAVPSVPVPAAKPPKKGRPVRLADRLLLTSHRSTFLTKARRLGMPTGDHLQALALARGYALPDEEIIVPPIYSTDAWMNEFGDVDLAFALLSPGLTYSEQAICRGALILMRVTRITEPYLLARAAIKEHSRRVICHVAGIGLKCHPESSHWRKLAAIMEPLSREIPTLPEGVLPDDAIFDVFARSDFETIT